MLARQIVIGFCIAFILPLLVYTGVTVFYPQPKTEDYFKQAAPPPSTATAEERQQYAAKQQSERPGQQAAYREARRAFTQALILVAAPLGIAAILIGSLDRFTRLAPASSRAVRSRSRSDTGATGSTLTIGFVSSRCSAA
jgi:hypothetical protein